MDKKIIKRVIIAGILLIANIVLLSCNFSVKTAPLKLTYNVQSNKESTYQVFYNDTYDFGSKVINKPYTVSKTPVKLSYEFPVSTNHIRLDLGECAADITLSDIKLSYYYMKIDIGHLINIHDKSEMHYISELKKEENVFYIKTTGEDPYITLHLNNIHNEMVDTANNVINSINKIVVCVMFNLLLIVLIKKRATIKRLFKELLLSRNLIWNLSKNDFKTKYAGSYLGITWAFVQPIVTVLVYWFVFQVGFRSGDVGDFPFVLWLISGIVPWFFFSDALSNATNSMIEYSYLVKKVVFKISILPIVKIVSALFVHLFFIGFTIFLFAVYGYPPHLYMLQIVYYTICMIILVLGISYATSAIIIFFKDLGQIISIFLQIGMWMTPIMWNYEMIQPKYRWILKLNPMDYIVTGYRDSLIYQTGLIGHLKQGIYFWLVAITLFAVGIIIFKRLKVHFADVL